MAGVLFRRLLLSSSRLERLALSRLNPTRRSAVTSSTGAVLSKPYRSSNLGLVWVALFVSPFVYVGWSVGKLFAEKMEELDVFVPDDDDDDD